MKKYTTACALALGLVLTSLVGCGGKEVNTVIEQNTEGQMSPDQQRSYEEYMKNSGRPASAS